MAGPARERWRAPSSSAAAWRHQRQTAFRAYGSIQESVSDFANLLKGSPRYRNAIAAGGNAQAYVNSIGQSGYATDPEYANKLNDILNGSTLRMALNVGSKKL